MAMEAYIFLEILDMQNYSMHKSLFSHFIIIKIWFLYFIIVSWWTIYKYATYFKLWDSQGKRP